MTSKGSKASRGSTGLTPSPARAARAATQRRRRFWLLLAGAFALLCSLVVLGVAPLFRPVATAHLATAIRVPAGSGVPAIATLLEGRGVIRSALAFRAYLRWNRSGPLKAGDYVLSPDMSLEQIAHALELGPTGSADGRIRVTVPEGLTLKQIAGLLEERGVCSADGFLRVATSPMAIAELHADFPLPKETLEGYLFPATYRFAPGASPEAVVQEFIVNFSTRIARPYQRELEARRASLHTIVTIASLIEREARVPQDRQRIAGVLDNRLRRGKRLQVDATVLYALGHHKDQVLYRDLKIDSPYNTYRRKGLPPGPIANPGVDSVRAALHPEKNDFLYYVARPNGAHLFSRTLADHDAACRQARLERQALERRREVSPGG